MSEQARIAYIEDHEASRGVMKLMLDLLGYSDLTLIEDTHNVLSALKVRNMPFDVVFLDVNLKPLDGYAVCELVRRDPAFEKTPVVGVTASATPADMRRMKAAGFNGCIAKPISYSTFSGQLERILSGADLWEDE